MNPLITDEQSLKGASHDGYEIPVYDDGYGGLYIHRDSMGISGIVRAQNENDAYDICEDEFFPEADETVEELKKEYGFEREHVKMLTNKLGSIWEATREDFNGSELKPGIEFYKWETVETPCEDENGWTENELFQESYGFRPNGPNKKDKIAHGIYAKDLNGDSLETLTAELAAALGIVLVIEDN